MFQFTKNEAYLFLRSQIVTLEKKQDLKSQFVTSSYGGRRKLPFAFTEQGIAMLSSVLNSERAIRVNIQIIRTFTKLRELIATNKDLREKIERKYDQQFRVVFDAIKRLLESPSVGSSRPIGFNK